MTAGRAEFGGIGDLMTAIFTEHRFEPPIALNLLQKCPRHLEDAEGGWSN